MAYLFPGDGTGASSGPSLSPWVYSSARTTNCAEDTERSGPISISTQHSNGLTSFRWILPRTSWSPNAASAAETAEMTWLRMWPSAHQCPDPPPPRLALTIRIRCEAGCSCRSLNAKPNSGPQKQLLLESPCCTCSLVISPPLSPYGVSTFYTRARAITRFSQTATNDETTSEKQAKNEQKSSKSAPRHSTRRTAPPTAPAAAPCQLHRAGHRSYQASLTAR